MQTFHQVCLIPKIRPQLQSLFSSNLEAGENHLSSKNLIELVPLSIATFFAADGYDLISKRARLILCNFMVIMKNIAGEYLQTPDIASLFIAEVFFKQILRNLLLLSDNKDLDHRKKELLIIVYSDCIHILPSIPHIPYVHRSDSIHKVTILQNSMLYTKHLIDSIVKIGKRESNLFPIVEVSLRKMAKKLKACGEGWVDRIATNNGVYCIYEHLSGFCLIMAELFKCEKIKGKLHLTESLKSELVSWASKFHSISMTQSFVLPLVTILSSNDRNWEECSSFILEILKIKPLIESDKFARTDLIKNYLLGVASKRVNPKKTEESAVVVKYEEAVDPGTIWAINMLGILSLTYSGLTEKLVGLFHHESYRIRLQVAQVLAIRCLNSESNTTHIRHCLDSPCSFASHQKPILSFKPFDLFLNELDLFMDTNW